LSHQAAQPAAKDPEFQNDLIAELSELRASRFLRITLRHGGVKAWNKFRKRSA
jgi:hypothetical protein